MSMDVLAPNFDHSHVQCKQQLCTRKGQQGGGGGSRGPQTDLIAVAIHPDLFYQVTCAKVHLKLLSSNVLSCSRHVADVWQAMSCGEHVAGAEEQVKPKHMS